MREEEETKVWGGRRPPLLSTRGHISTKPEESSLIDLRGASICLVRECAHGFCTHLMHALLSSYSIVGAGFARFQTGRPSGELDARSVGSEKAVASFRIHSTSRAHSDNARSSESELEWATLPWPRDPHVMAAPQRVGM